MKKSKSQEEKEVISKCLEKIHKANGTLTPDLVVKHAKNESSPLHRFFEWDDSKAAHDWRLVQGRNLIGSVWIEIETTDEVIRVPKYVRDPRCASDEQGYCPIVDVKNKESVARDSLGLELDRVRSVLERALHIADFLGLSKEVSRLLKTTTKLRERLIAD